MARQVNRVCGITLVVLSLATLLSVLSGFTQPPQTDEGTAAHIFQLSIIAFLPASLLFLATADWKQPVRSFRPLAFAVATVAFAFVFLFWLEHVR